MVRAYVLIELAAGRSRNLVEVLKAQERVRTVTRVTGSYDVIAELEAKDVDEVSDTVNQTIHSVLGVVRTTTCVSLI